MHREGGHIIVDPLKAIQAFSQTCIRCGLCARTDCGNFRPGTPCLGDICDVLISDLDDKKLRDFPFTCALCDLCTAYCPVNLHCINATKPLRALILKKHPELRARYRFFRTDLKYNLFSLMRSQAQGDMGRVELIAGKASGNAEMDATAFFPGCSIFSYGPKLCDEVFNWLHKEKIAAWTLYFCCGATFYDVGFYDEFKLYRKRACAYLAKHGIKRLVVACSHCAHELVDMLEGTDVKFDFLPEVLFERGMTSKFCGKISMHDACYDRYSSAFGNAARKMFPDAQLVALANEKRSTMCCGAGGLVSEYAPAYCEYRRNKRFAQIDDVETDEILSTCFSCVNSLQRENATTPVRHYLEEIFDVDTDWPRVYASVDALFCNPQAMALLESDEPTFEA